MMASDIKPLHENIEKSYKCICDGFGCSKGATQKIDVNAGIFGTISLSLCSMCVKKFNGKNEEIRKTRPRKPLKIANGVQA